HASTGDPAACQKPVRPRLSENHDKWNQCQPESPLPAMKPDAWQQDAHRGVKEHGDRRKFTESQAEVRAPECVPAAAVSHAPMCTWREHEVAAAPYPAAGPHAMLGSHEDCHWERQFHPGPD